MSRIAVWFDGGGVHGLGNIRRSVELGEVIASRGHIVSMKPLSDVAATLGGKPTDSGADPDVVVIDVPYNADELVERARSLGLKTAVLDHEGTVLPDLVVNLKKSGESLHGCRSLWGPDYAIIRREILSAAKDRARTAEVLVIVGGGDLDGLAERIAERLPAAPLCVVQGPAGGKLDLAAKNARVVYDPPDLPSLMARCAWGVTTGGTSMLEMLSLGKAVHVVPRTRNEEIFAQPFIERGCLLGLGLDGLREPDAELRIACEQLGPRMIDGQGAERIARALETLL